MFDEKLADKLDVTEKLVLALQHDLFVVILSVSLAIGLSLCLQKIEIALLLENFLEAVAAVVEKFFAELTELEVGQARLLGL